MKISKPHLKLLKIASLTLSLILILGFIYYQLEKTHTIIHGHIVPGAAKQRFNDLNKSKTESPGGFFGVAGTTLEVCVRGNRTMFVVTGYYPTIDDFQGVISYYTSDGMSLETKPTQGVNGNGTPIPQDSSWNPKLFNCQE